MANGSKIIAGLRDAVAHGGGCACVHSQRAQGSGCAPDPPPDGNDSKRIRVAVRIFCLHGEELGAGSPLPRRFRSSAAHPNWQRAGNRYENSGSRVKKLYPLTLAPRARGLINPSF
jgi:hypothetical protein